MNRVEILIIALIFALLGCDTTKRKMTYDVAEINNEETRKIDIDLSSVVSNNSIDNSFELKLSEFISDSIRFVGLETNDHSIIGNIKKVLVDKKHIYIYDDLDMSIKIFYANDGLFKAKIQKVGDGPDEYSRIRDFTIEHTTGLIVIADDQRHRLVYYNASGVFVKEKSSSELFFNEIALPENGQLIYFNNQGMELEGGNRYRLFQFSKSDKLTASFKCEINQENLLLTKNKFFTQNDSSVYLSPLKSFKIYKLEGENFKSKYEFDFGTLIASEDELLQLKNQDKVVEAAKTGNSGLLFRDDRIYMIDHFFENSDYITSMAFFGITKVVRFFVEKESGNIIYPYDFVFDIPFPCITSTIEGVHDDMFFTHLPQSTLVERMQFYAEVNNLSADQLDQVLISYNENLYTQFKKDIYENPSIVFYRFNKINTKDQVQGL